ncbi:hypothetical protein DIPPA_20807 [Diplonema papillatum]|nr:hypothetical protein DIPPA_20807 [Diplonema papillatum]|eukprot:gene2489-3858_t
MGVDTVALATQFVELRLAKRNDEAAAMCDANVKWTTPTMTGTEVNEGLDKVKAYWAKQDKDLPKVVDKSDFTTDSEFAATRTLTVRKMMMNIKLHQTFVFNADGKLVEHTTKRM